MTTSVRFSGEQNRALKRSAIEQDLMSVIFRHGALNMTQLNRRLGGRYRHPSNLLRYLEPLKQQGFLDDLYVPRRGHYFMLTYRGFLRCQRQKRLPL